ncbi:MAG: selenide, water dikinase SelD, partial [Oscillospiraceae bacterium]
VAAANSLSDVYAMGGVPKLAMNLLCVPNCLSTDVVGEILRGGADKAIEAGCIIAGGHSIEDDVPKYGLCVTGFINPRDILRNSGAKKGDVIIITKPLGSGILNTAAKAELLNEQQLKSLYYYMTLLNKEAALSLSGLKVNACTDITGFGLIGHSGEMMEGSNLTMEIDSTLVPIMDGSEEYAKMGIIPAGAYKNREFMKGRFTDQGVEIWRTDIICDPQTSGGLLLSMPPEDGEKYLKSMHAKSQTASIVGKVTDFNEALVKII